MQKYRFRRRFEILNAGDVYLFTHDILIFSSYLCHMGEKLRNFLFEAWCFVTSIQFLKSCGSILAAFFGLGLMTLWGLKCYTNHGESMEVPDFKGMRIESAIDRAEGRSFSIVVSDSIFLPGKMPGMVIDQTPKALSRVKKNRTIYLTITKTTADKVPLPDLAMGDQYDTYKRKLRQMNVRDTIIERRYDPKVQENTVLEVFYNGENVTKRIRSGFRVDVGGLVELVVSSGTSDIRTIPDFVCRPLSEALFEIDANRFVVGSIIPDATVTDQTTAYVYQQEPTAEPGATIGVGEMINLYITQERPAACGGTDIPEGEDQ